MYFGVQALGRNSILKMDAAVTSETLRPIWQTTGRQVPEDRCITVGLRPIRSILQYDKYVRKYRKEKINSARL